MRRFFPILFLSLLGCLLTQSGFGQQRLELHTHKPLYTSGEKMAFFIYDSNGKTGEVQYAELLDVEGKVIQRITLKNKGTIAAGSFDIPLDQQSSWYLIRSYSLWMPATQIRNLQYKAIPIYNEFDKEILSTNQAAELKAPLGDANLSIEVATEIQNGTSVIDLNLKAPQAANQALVVSVIDQSLLELGRYLEAISPQIEAQAFAAPPSSKPLTQLLFLGRIPQNPEDQFLATFYVAENRQSDWVSFNEEMVFGMQLPEFQGEKHAYLLAMEPLGKIRPLDMELFWASEFLEFPEISFPPLPYNAAVQEYLADSRKRRIIDDIFDKKLISDQAIPDSALQFGKPDRRYVPKDYVQFQGLPDFIKEVAKLIQLKKNKKGYSMKVFMEKNIIADHPPLVFLNGFLVHDHNELLDLSVNAISRIDIYRRQSTLLKEFKTIGRNGVIAFYTKDSALRPKAGSHQILSGFQQSSGKVQPLMVEGAPTFSPTLYWNPMLQMTNTQEVSLTFPGSQDKGEYAVEVFVADGEKLSVMTKTFQLDNVKP